MANNSQFPGAQPHQPHIIGSLGPPQGSLPTMSMQYRPAGPAQQGQAYIPSASQQFQPIGHTNVGMPPPPPPMQFPPPMAPLPARPVIAGDSVPPAQATVIPAQPQPNVQNSSNYMPGFGEPMVSPASYNPPTTENSTNQYQPMSLTANTSFPAEGQSWLSTGNPNIKPVTPVQQTGEPSAASVNRDLTFDANNVEKVPSIWIEHTARSGKKYYYNRRTRLSTWEKPLELMSQIERADASTDWREYTSPDGRKYYHNRVTKQSKWRIPEELKLAREGVNLESENRTQAVVYANSQAPAVGILSSVNALSSNADASSFSTQSEVSSPIPVPAISAEQPVVTSGSAISATDVSSVALDAVNLQTSLETATSVADTEDDTICVTPATTVTMTKSSIDDMTTQDTVTTGPEISPGNTEEAEKGGQDEGKSEEKSVGQGPIVYESKLEAKNAFKALLETANIGSDWTWDQAMRVIINDRRYGALKSLGERKQAFNEFVSQKKKQEAEERRARLKKARENFKIMLEESKELTSSTRWSKAIAMFEDDERFKAIDRTKDREDLFEDYMKELEKKERAKALEEKKRNRMEYLEFLKSCDFIKASSQWRRVQDRLEADERCSRLEKIDRLEIFQEHIRDLEREEEEQRKLRMEEQRKAERKNRDEFRKLMEEHVAAGILTVKVHWRDYCQMVKDSPAYLAVASNTSGATAKDLFDDVAEELKKQYLEDKDQIKEAVKIGEITLTSTWTLEDFKAAITKKINSLVSDVNLKLVFDELLERAREKEEKEAKRRKRLGDDFFEFLHTSKEISPSSRWEDCKQLVEDRFVGEESFFKEIYDKFILEGREKEKEDRKRKEDKAKRDKDRRSRDKKKEKQRREKEKGDESRKERDRPKHDGSGSDRTDSYNFDDERRSGRERDKKHRKRHSDPLDDTGLDENEKDRSRNAHRHSDDRKKLKRVEQQTNDF